MDRLWTIAGLLAVAAALSVVGVAGASTPQLIVMVGVGVLASLGVLIVRRGEADDPTLGPLAELERRIAHAAETRQETRQRADAAGRFREEFVGAVRHELKTPLNAILGFTQVLLDEIEGELTPQQQEDVTAIREAGLYLSELVEAVLEEWVPDEDRPLSIGPVDLGALLGDVGRLLEGQTVGKGVKVRVEVAADTPQPLGDLRRLRQVMINLGTNALRATARGTVTLSAAPDPDGVRVTVRDTGTGIAPEMLPRLFEEFAQAGSLRSQAGGTGLGLALSRDLVEWHGGRIEVESSLGVGSVFHVILPLELD